MNKNIWKIGALLILWLVITMAFATKTSASDGLPPGGQVFEVNGVTYLYIDGDNDDILVQVCPCADECENQEQVDIPDEKEPMPTIVTETPDPTVDPTFIPTTVPTSDPTSTPIPTTEPAPKPTKTPKPKCNAGIGNGSEYYGSTECDPGNSEQHGGQHD